MDHSTSPSVSWTANSQNFEILKSRSRDHVISRSAKKSIVDVILEKTKLYVSSIDGTEND